MKIKEALQKIADGTFTEREAVDAAASISEHWRLVCGLNYNAQVAKVAEYGIDADRWEELMEAA